MKNDPIVEEIHRVREKLLDECGGDLEQLMDHIKRAEAQDQSRIVTAEDVRRKRQTRDVA